MLKEIFESQDVRSALTLAILAGLGYITYWLKSHVGKSNGEGNVNKQLSDLSKKLNDHIEDESSDVKSIREIVDINYKREKSPEGD